MHFAIGDCVYYEGERHWIDGMDENMEVLKIGSVKTGEMKKVDRSVVELKEDLELTDGEESGSEEEQLDENKGQSEVEVIMCEPVLPVPTTSTSENGSATTGVPRYRPTEAEKADFLNKQKNKKTACKTQSAAKQLAAYMESVDEYRAITDIPPLELNSLIEDFVMTVRKQDGTEYEPTSIRGTFAAIARYLDEKRYPDQLMKSAHFKGAREMLKSKFKVRETYNCNIPFNIAKFTVPSKPIMIF